MKVTEEAMTDAVNIDNIPVGRPAPFLLIAGPCVIEDEKGCREIASLLKQVTDETGVPFIFKASCDKANRTSIDSFRGPGMEKGLDILSGIRRDFGILILSDVHRVSEVRAAGRVLDVLQIPAFLCRQTDLLVAAAKAGKAVNIKKGQFVAPSDMKYVVEKVTTAGNRRILLTERGAMFGYNNLVADFRSIRIMQQTGFPVIFDATHSVQLPGGAGASSSGRREFAPILARAAIAAGADGIFLEVHPDPDRALSDGPNALPLDAVKPLLLELKAIQRVLDTPYP